MGHIRKRGNKYSVVLYDKDTARYVWFSGYDTEAEAEAAIPQLEKKLAQHGYAIKDNPSVLEYVQAYYNAEIDSQRAKSTQSTYSNAIIELSKHKLSALKLKRIKPIDIRTYISELKKEGKSASTIKTYITPLKSAFNQAEIDGIVEITPYRGIRITQDKRSDNLDTFTKEQVNTLLKAIRHDYEVYPAVMIALHTGMRIGEICALTWKDITTDSIIVNKIIDRDNKVRKDTKTHDTRTIPLSATLRKMFTELKEMMLRGEYPNKQHIIVDAKGSNLLPANLRHKYKKALARTKLPQIRFHGLRDTFATRAIEAGVDVKSISLILGHADVNITLQRYVHPSDDMKQTAVDTLNDFYISKSISSQKRKAAEKE